MSELSVSAHCHAFHARCEQAKVTQTIEHELWSMVAMMVRRRLRTANRSEAEASLPVAALVGPLTHQQLERIGDDVARALLESVERHK